MIVGLFCALCVSTITDASAQTRRALLIGINEYQTEEFQDLRGAVNDVVAMREILISKYNFPESNITVLTDSDATRQNILDAMDDLVGDSTADDMVYVHYSGHGSQVRDQNGDEADETEVTNDDIQGGI